MNREKGAKALTGESRSDPHIEIARRAVESFVREGVVPDASDSPAELLERSAGAFVCLKKHGQLRGCMGTIHPVTGSLAEEIRDNAINSAARDPRFPPVSAEELPDLSYSVDVLEEPEDVPDISHLEPRTYGVIVRSGAKSGLLLPDLEGVDTAEEQVRIAMMKAGIQPGEPVSLQRFKVTRYE